MLPSFHELSLQQLSVGPRGERAARADARRRSARLRPFYLTRERVRESADDLCAICQARLEDETPKRELPCGHQFHEACIHPWLLRTPVCPTCRETVPGTEEGADSGEQLILWARNGQLEDVTHFVNSRAIANDVMDRALWAASRNGRDGVVSFLIQTVAFPEDSIENAVLEAAQQGHANAMAPLLEAFSPLPDSVIIDAMNVAGEEGYEDVVRLLLEADLVPRNQGALIRPALLATQNEHVGVLRLLLATRRVPTREVVGLLMDAAMAGSVRTVRLLLEMRSFHMETIVRAVDYSLRDGHVGVLSLLLEIPGIPLDELTSARWQESDEVIELMTARLTAYEHAGRTSGVSV